MGSKMKKLHVFFFPLMAHGHMIPMIDIARQFAARGTKSTIISTPGNVSHFSDNIARDQQSGLDIGTQIIPFPSVQAGLPAECEDFNSLDSPEMAYNFSIALSLLQEPLMRLIEEHHPDCLIADTFFTWATNVAKKHGIPRLVFHGTNNFVSCVLANIRRYVPQAKATSDSEIFVIPGLPDHIEMSKSQLDDHGDTTKSRYTEFREKMYETEVQSFGVVVNSFYELEPGYAEYYKKDMGRTAWNIGLVSLYNRNIIDKAQRGRKMYIDEHPCLTWLDTKRPNSILYVSFGSISRNTSAQLLEIAMGLEASNVSFIWVVRLEKIKGEDQFLPEGFEERVEGKGLIIKDWAPQMLILDHPAIGGFMTHCGWNSILEGVSAGLPFITWPMFAEQFNNEKLVSQVLKTGIEVGSKVWNAWVARADVSVTRDKIEEAANQLMSNEEDAEDRRARAKALAEMAKKAVVEGGSSYADLTNLIEELRLYSLQSN
ncbi:hypothetical protein ACHQM5_023984 [Ranunculus cassubicifolius]